MGFLEPCQSSVRGVFSWVPNGDDLMRNELSAFFFATIKSQQLGCAGFRTEVPSGFLLSCRGLVVNSSWNVIN